MYSALFNEAAELEITWLKSGKLEDADSTFIEEKLKFYEKLPSKKHCSSNYCVDFQFIAPDLQNLSYLKAELVGLGYNILELNLSSDEEMLRGQIRLLAPGDEFVDNTLTQVYNRIKNLVSYHVYLTGINIKTVNDYYSYNFEDQGPY